MMRWTRSAAAAVLGGLLYTPIAAQTVTPQPATTIDPILVEYTLIESQCGCSISSVTSTSGSEIEIDVAVECFFLQQRCTPPTPLVLRENIGTLRPGEYDLSIVGTIRGEPIDPATTSFTVEVGPFGDLAAPVPAVGPAALYLLILVLGGVGIVLLRK